ncbi:hypothetical protein GCM10022245_05660 [Streptomyces mayteni]
MAWLSAGWAMWERLAAAVTLSSSATARKYRSCLISTTSAMRYTLSAGAPLRRGTIPGRTDGRDGRDGQDGRDDRSPGVRTRLPASVLVPDLACGFRP